MQSREKNNLVFIRLFKDEDVIKMLKEACKKHDIQTGIIISGIGQLKNVKLGYFKEKGNYTPQMFKKPLELLSLSGNICKAKDEHLLHLHTILGDEDKRSIGGHFIEGIVSVTGEIVILKSDMNLNRKIDLETGLKNLWFQ